jgi:hypothetical protein
VTPEKRFFKARDPVHKALLAFTVMMQVDFDVQKVVFRHFGECIQEMWTILFFGVKACVARSPPLRIAMPGCNL